MAKKGLAAVFSLLAVGFYIAIIMYVFFAVLHIGTLANFASALIFEMIGFVMLLFLVLCSILFKPVKTGYAVPLIVVTVIYTMILDVLNLALVVTMPPVLFVLSNVVLFFIYFVISVPMYLMGRR